MLAPALSLEALPLVWASGEGRGVLCTAHFKLAFLSLRVERRLGGEDPFIVAWGHDPGSSARLPASDLQHRTSTIKYGPHVDCKEAFAPGVWRYHSGRAGRAVRSDDQRPSAGWFCCREQRHATAGYLDRA